MTNGLLSSTGSRRTESSYAQPVDATTRDATVIEPLRTVIAANPKMPGIC